MLYYVLDSNLNVVDMVELYTSMIWTNRFWDVGDFELYLPADPKSVSLFTTAIENNYVIVGSNDLKHGMLPLKIQLDTSRSDGNYISVKGYDLKYILNRRIVWEYRNVGGEIDKELEKLVYCNAINPTNPDRIIPNLILATDIPEEDRVTTVMSGCLFGENLAVAIKNRCKLYGYGWDIELDMPNKKMIFKILKSTDRRKTVLFSNEMDNLYTSKYVIDKTQPKNIAYVNSKLSKYDEDTMTYKPYDLSQIVTLNTVEEIPTGLSRYELYVENNEDYDSSKYTISQYAYTLRETAKKELRNSRTRDEVSGEVISNYTYQLGVDYNIGDIVKVENEYGVTFSSRVTEVIISRAKNKDTIIPSFAIIDHLEEAEPIDPNTVFAFIVGEDKHQEYAVTPNGDLLMTSKIYKSTLTVYQTVSVHDDLEFINDEHEKVPVDVVTRFDPKYDYKMEEKSKWE